LYYHMRNPERAKVNVAHILTRNAELYPNRFAIDDRLTGARFTYAELEERVMRLANALRDQGIRRGETVAVMLYNEHAMVETMMACARIGAVFAPLNVRWIGSELAAYANFHQCKAFVTRADMLDRFEAVTAKVRIARGAADAEADVLDYEALIAGARPDVVAVETSLEEPFRLIATGGTTGKSKGVVHSHVGTYFTVLSNIAEFGIRRNWNTIMIAPAYHGAGIDWGMLPVMWRAGTVIFPASTSFDAKDFIDQLRTRPVEFLLLVPAVIEAVYRAWDGASITSPQVIISTSAPTPPAVRRRLAEMFPNANLMAGAGISESVNMIIQSPGEFLEHPASAGEPHLDTRLLILDEEDRQVARGQPGQIALRGFNTALCYNGNDDAGAATWRKRKNDPEGLEWCFTGDIGVMDEAGRVSIVDRFKDIILTGGETVPSVEVETVYFDCPDVSECAAIGMHDDRWGEAITLVVVKRDKACCEKALAQSLFEYGRGRLSAYKVPKQIVFLDALPRSHFGKILKNELRDHPFDQIHRPAKAAPLAPSAAETN